ncbi:MAG: glycosyltransferase family 2 protein [Ruminococcus flavefaciens]|nr:glycosyltransferase family 2 protein [Ruminococcus flavefaciens]
MEKTGSKYSIIVPVYNVEKYLDECIGSVLAQTYQNWELIIVDDESSDGSLCIARKYEQMDSRIHVYQKPHGGLPHTRNWGMKYITGDYLALLDGDDYWGSEHLAKVEEVVGGTKCDMCIMNNHTNFTREWKQQVILFPVDGSTNGLNLEEKLDILFSVDNHLPASAVLTVYRADFLRSNALEYEDSYKCSEDLDFFLHCISKVRNIKVAQHEFYFYRQDNQGAMTKNLTGEMLLCRLNIYKKWYDFYQNKMIEKFDCKEIQDRISVDMPLNIAGYFELRNGDPDKKRIKQFFRMTKYIWCREGITGSYFWTFYIFYPWKMLNDRMQVVLRYIKERRRL